MALLEHRQAGQEDPDRPAVLIVDDIPDNLLALEGVLRRDDVEIVTAGSGRAALETLLERDVAVAIIDVQMPEMDGFELAELIRGVDRTRRVPIIFVTAGSRTDYRAFAGYETGAIDFLFKPLDGRVLRAKVDVLVTLERQRRQVDLAREQAERHRAEAEEAIAELERTARLNELFTGILGHDLRNPLSAIVMSARYALERDEARALARPLSRILGSATRMERMVDQLLDFTRIRLGAGIQIEPRPVDLAGLLRQVVEELAVAHRSCTFDLEHEGDPRGFWDPDRLSQLFSNLIANAVQHGREDRPVGVRLDGSASDVVRVEVHNDGGIPAALVPRLFEPLDGAKRSRRNASGLGLGLFISQEIAGAHRGSIGVRSEEASGTTFTVQLPRTSQ